MYDVRLRLMDDTGRMRGRMLDPLEFTATMSESTQSTLTFSLSELTAGRLDTPFVVAVFASDGGPHKIVRGGEFIVWEDDADDSDVTGTVKYTGIEFIPWLLSRNLMHWSSSAKNGTRTWLQNKQPSSVGYLISGLIAEGKARGWGASLSFGFTAARDSRGAAWTAAERQSEAWPLLTSVADILRQVTDNGLCDWYCDGTTLQLVRPGSGDVRQVTLGGPLFIDRPVKSSFKDVFTHLTVVPEKARNWLYLSNAGATNRFGRLEASQTQSGVKDHSVATKNAQPIMTAGRATRRQFSFDWIPDAGGPIPFEDFYIGDTVLTQTRAGKVAQRVIGLQLTRKGQDPVKVRAVTGDKMLGTAARAARKIGSVNVGGGVPGGSGATVPVSPGQTFPLPASPTGVHQDANVSQWGADGSALTSVTIAWDEVSQAEDGSEVDVEVYEISARRDGTGDPRSVVATTDALSWTATTWAVGVTRLVSVRAVAPNGDRSAWSTEITVTPESPARPLKVTGLQVTGQTGSWRADGTAQVDVALSWNAVALDTGGRVIPVTYEIASRFPERTDARPETNAATVSDWEPGKSRWVRVRAVSGGGKGDWSDELEVMVVTPASIVPKAPVELAVSSNTAAFQSDGSALATVTVSWASVTESIDGAPVSVREYEFRAGQDTQRVTSASATFTVPTDRRVTVSVRALTTLDVWGDQSAPMDVTGAKPAPGVTTPSVPVLTPGLGGVAYRFDGLTADGAALPAGFGWVIAETAPVPAGPWTARGATLRGSGGGAVSAAAGTSVSVRFRAFDTLGRPSGTSAVATATAEGVSLDDIDPDLSGELDEIRYTADGKSRIYVSATEPVRERGRNYFADPSFASPAGYSPWMVVAGGIEKSGTGTQSGAYVAPSEIPAAPGERYQVRATRADLAGGTGQASIYMQRKNGAGAWVFWTSAAALPAAGTVVGPWMTVPADTTAIRLGFYTEATMPAATKVRLDGVAMEQARGGDQWWVLDPSLASIVGVKVWNGTAWVNYQIVAQDIIAAGTIKGVHVEANTLSVNHVEPSFGDDLNLSANESVTIIVGRQNEQADQIADVSESVGEVQATAEAASSAAGTAQATANGAATAATSAAAAAANVGARLDQHQLYFKVEGDSAKIGRPNGSAELRLAPERIEMTQNAVVVSYWEGGVFVADEARLDSAQIGNHQFMAYGAGRTIVRPL